MGFTTLWKIEITSFGNPVTEKQLSDAISKIPGVKTVDIDEEYIQKHTYNYHKGSEG